MNNSFVENNTINYYYINKPNIEEFVLVKFTEKHEDFFKAKLCEYYGYIGILNLQNATKKKKIYKWNKIISLNKSMIASVSNIEEDKKIVELTLLNIPSQDSKNNEYQELVDYFSDNKSLEVFIKSFVIQHNYNFENIWKNIIYYIDSLRIKEKKNNISIFTFIKQNLDTLDLINDEYKEIFLKLKISYATKFVNNIKKLSTKFYMSSSKGINSIKNFINTNIINFGEKYKILYISAPYYILESYDSEITQDEHLFFINNLIVKSNTIEGLKIKNV